MVINKEEKRKRIKDIFNILTRRRMENYFRWGYGIDCRKTEVRGKGESRRSRVRE